MTSSAREYAPSARVRASPVAVSTLPSLVSINVTFWPCAPIFWSISTSFCPTRFFTQSFVAHPLASTRIAGTTAIRITARMTRLLLLLEQPTAGMAFGRAAGCNEQASAETRAIVCARLAGYRVW